MNHTPQIIRSLWFVVIAYLLLIGPLALNFNFYYPDEVHYSDAAFQMLHNGDYFTPLQGSGEFRFNKPILTYWFVLLGFKLFGVNAFATRIFFFLASIAILLLVYRISKLIFDNRDSAFIATVIASTNATLVMSSIRSIPDILLCLFITFSALGFSGFIKFGNQTPNKYKWLLFLGLALAFEVKGIPAVLFGGIGIGFLLINPWQRIKLKTLLHFPAVLSAIILASFWFVLMFYYYGQFFYESFYNDQLGDRISLNASVILTNVGLSILLFLVVFIPWFTFISRSSFRTKFKSTEERTFQLFIITWTITTIVLSSMVFKFYDRYLLPIIPLFAVWLGHLISTNIQYKPKMVKIWGSLFAIINGLLLIIATILNIGLKFKRIEFSFLMVAIVITIFTFYSLFKTKNKYWLYISIMLFALNLAFITRRISFPNEGTQLTQILKTEKINKTEEIGFIGEPQIASKLRVASKDEFHITNLYELYATYESENYKMLIVSEKDMPLLQVEEFQNLGVSVSWNSKESFALLASIFKGDFQNQFKLLGKKYYILQRKE